MKNIQEFENFQISESEIGDETTSYVQEAIQKILPIIEDYCDAVDAGDGDPDDARNLIKDKIIEALKNL